MKMTMSKIASLAGASRGAVDKTIHNRPGVREEVRQRVLRVIDETGYIPLAERKAVQKQLMSKSIAIILPRLTNPYFAALRRYLDEQSAFIPDIKLTYYPCDTTDIAGMLDLLHRLHDQPIDALLFRGVRNIAIQTALDTLGRPVVFFDSDMSSKKRLCFIGEDCIKSGRLAASLLAKSIGGYGQVAVLTGSEHIPSHRQRLEGFLETMRTMYPDIAVVRHLYTQEQPESAYRLTGRLLVDFPNLSGVCNLAGCSGEIGQAILEQRQKGSVPLVCFSTAGDVADLIRKRVVSFCISLQPREQARLMLETMCNYLQKEIHPAHSFVKVPVSIVVDENLDSLTADFAQLL